MLKGKTRNVRFFSVSLHTSDRRENEFDKLEEKSLLLSNSCCSW